jgi:hypothetical protein
MNSERRHELQQNDLAIWLNKVNKSVEPYSKPIAIVLGVFLVGALVYLFYQSEQRAEQSEATLQLIQAAAGQDAEVLMAVSDTYPDTEAGDWARLYQGQLLLSQGMQSLFNDRENAEVLLGDAQQALRAAISRSNETLLLSRANYGIAQAAEGLGNLEEAIEAMVEKAQQRIDILSKPEAQAFVTWFSEQDFSPPDPSLPPSLPGGNQLPDMPDLSLPPLDFGGDEEATAPKKEGGLQLPEETADGDAPAADPDQTPEGDSTTEAEADEAAAASEEADTGEESAGGDAGAGQADTEAAGQDDSGEAAESSSSEDSDTASDQP